MKKIELQIGFIMRMIKINKKLFNLLCIFLDKTTKCGIIIT